MLNGIRTDAIWTGACALLDVLGIWLVVNPGGVVALWTAHRTTVSDAGRYIGRFVGTVILWVQLLQLAGYAKGKTVHSAWEWLLFLLLVGATAFFGYKIVMYFASRQERGKLLDKSQWRGRAAETPDEARARYGAAWRAYRRLRIAFPLSFIGWVPFAFLLFSVFRVFGWNENVAMTVVLAWIPLVPIAGWKWSNWRCPRCGYAFKGKYALFFPKHCHHCGLPVWAESPDE